MGRIPPEDLEAVRSQIPIVEVIGEHVALKPSGASMKGLCPFHQEKTPSFNVNPGTNTFYCFGCEESGDVIDFIQHIEGEGFRWAVKYLADRYNIPVHFDADEDGAASKKTRLIAAHEIAAEAYAYALRNDPEAEPARVLLTDRHYDVPEAATRFGCGYAPRRRSISDLLTSKGFTSEEITEAGLAIDRGGKLRDRFQGRLVWTIKNSFGKPIGFGARRLYDNDPVTSKFINTSETPIYKKSTVLFGLDLARKEIARTRRAVVVEGYTDVMAMHLAGEANAVAPCGTAFTSEQMHTLRRLVGDAGEIVFAFDDDTAGQKAARTTYQEYNATLRRLSALPRSGGLDPDELRRTQGDQALHDLVDQRIPLVKAVIMLVVQSMPQDTPEDRVAALDAALPYLNDISDRLIRHEYAVEVARLLRFDANQVETRISPTAGDTHDEAPVPQEELRPEWIEKEVLRVFAQNENIAREHLATWDIDLKFHERVSGEAIDLIRKGLDVSRDDGLAWPLHLRQVCVGDEEARLVTALTADAIPVGGDDARTYTAELLQRLDHQADHRTVDDLKRKIATAGTSEERNSALRELMAHQKQSRR